MKKCIYVLFLCNFLFTEEINMRDYYYPIDKILDNPTVYIYKTIRLNYVSNEVIFDTPLYAKFVAHLDNYNKNLQEYDTVLTADYYDGEFNHVFQWVDIIKPNGTLILGDSKNATIIKQTPRPIVFSDSSICYSYQQLNQADDTVLYKITYKPVAKYADKINQDVLSLTFEAASKYDYSESYKSTLEVLYFKRGMGAVYSKGMLSYIFDIDFDSKNPYESGYYNHKSKLERIISLEEFEYLMSLKKP